MGYLEDLRTAKKAYFVGYILAMLAFIGMSVLAAYHCRRANDLETDNRILSESLLICKIENTQAQSTSQSPL